MPLIAPTNVYSSENGCRLMHPKHSKRNQERLVIGINVEYSCMATGTHVLCHASGIDMGRNRRRPLFGRHLDGRLGRGCRPDDLHQRCGNAWQEMYAVRQQSSIAPSMGGATHGRSSTCMMQVGRRMKGPLSRSCRHMMGRTHGC